MLTTDFWHSSGFRKYLILVRCAEQSGHSQYRSASRRLDRTLASGSRPSWIYGKVVDFVGPNSRLISLMRGTAQALPSVNQEAVPLVIQELPENSSFLMVQGLVGDIRRHAAPFPRLLVTGDDTAAQATDDSQGLVVKKEIPGPGLPPVRGAQ